MENTIGSWTTGQLIRFIEDMFRTNPPGLGPSASADELTVVEDLNVHGNLNFSLEQTTVGGAGGATALPATPLKYLRVKDSTGTVVVIPVYKSK